MSSAAWERYIRAYRREQMLQTFRCFAITAVVVGAVFLASEYMAA